MTDSTNDVDFGFEDDEPDDSYGEDHWQTKNGTFILITKMTMKHLINSVRLFPNHIELAAELGRRYALMPK